MGNGYIKEWVVFVLNSGFLTFYWVRRTATFMSVFTAPSLGGSLTEATDVSADKTKLEREDTQLLDSYRCSLGFPG